MDIIPDIVSGGLIFLGYLARCSIAVCEKRKVLYVFRLAPVSALLTAHGHDHIPDTQTFIKYDTVHS